MSRFVQYAFVGLLLGGLLLILVCPQPHLTGSFQATHGPTVTLRSLRSLFFLLLAIAAVAGSLAGSSCFGLKAARSTRFPALGSVLLC